jgi:hypothetical protein
MTITLNSIASPNNTSVINSNFQKIANAINDDLLKKEVDVGEANQMRCALDMNSNTLANLADGTSPQDAVTKSQLDNLDTGGQEGGIGETGETGATGPAGTKGDIGATGATGSTGAAGTNGTNGTNGSAGTNGTNGATGATGAAGTNGTNGTDGVDGTVGGIVTIPLPYDSEWSTGIGSGIYYYKVGDIVTLVGNAASTGTSGRIIGNLPEGFRPVQKEFCNLLEVGAISVGDVFGFVDPNGGVSVSLLHTIISPALYAFTGFSFIAAAGVSGTLELYDTFEFYDTLEVYT